MILLTLILSLPTENASIRMRAWRSLKAAGAAVLRDGVYLMPEREACRLTLEAVAADVQTGGGSAYVFLLEALESGAEKLDFVSLFDRSCEFAALLEEIAKARTQLTRDTVMEALKQARKLRKAFSNLAEIDFFPGEAQKQANAALQELELSAARALAPDEPHSAGGSIIQLSSSEFQGRVWATRQRPWVDRLACAWLIRRFIDPSAQLLWLESASDCPSDALGFDFDGATFSHVGARVTFEVLLASFSLEQPPLKRLGALVHFLDVGGIQPPEAIGIESALAGLRAAISDDDQLLAAASSIFDGLLANFQTETKPPQEPA